MQLQIRMDSKQELVHGSQVCVCGAHFSRECGKMFDLIVSHQN